MGGRSAATLADRPGREGEKMAKLKTLEAKNIKGLKELEIDFSQHGNLVVIGGDNGAGKTTALDTVLYLFGGKGAIPKDVLRHGSGRGEIEAELDSGLIVKRVITGQGVRLAAKNLQGATFSSPQAILNDLVRAANGKSTLGFDPLRFARMSPREQRDTLKELLGLDFTEEEDEKQRVLEERRQAQSEEKALAAEIESMEEIDEELPAEEVSIADLLEERKRRTEVNELNDELRRSLGRVREEIEGLKKRESELMAQLADIRASLVTKGQEAEGIAERVGEVQDEDVSEIDEKLKSLEDMNRRIRANNRSRATKVAYEDAVARVKAANQALESIEDRKREKLMAAKMPIPGLAFDEDGVTLHGVRMESLSGAERLMVSVAMAIAMEPELKVLLIRDGSLLDSGNLEELRRVAMDNDVTILLERVGDGPEVNIELKDGEVIRN